jgi:2-methylcitrate dehydratase PrpD
MDKEAMHGGTVGFAATAAGSRLSRHRDLTTRHALGRLWAMTEIHRLSSSREGTGDSTR